MCLYGVTNGVGEGRWPVRPAERVGGGFAFFHFYISQFDYSISYSRDLARRIISLGFVAR